MSDLPAGRAMDLADYCRRHGVDAAAVTAAVCQRMEQLPHRCICLAGSVIEGIGNAGSDLDAYVLADDPAQAACTFGTAQIVRVGAITVDIEFVQAARVDELIARMDGHPAQAWRDQRRSAAALAPGELKLLHNLLLAVPVEGAAFLQDLQARIDATILARLLFDRCAVLVDAVQQDVVGFIEANDHASARLSLRIQRQHVAGALLAALGMTNPAEKWRAVHMRMAASRFGSHALPGGATIADAAARWNALDAGIATAPPTQSLMQLSMLANAILPWGLQRFVDNLPDLGERDAPAPAPAAPGAGPATEAPLPALAWDCIVRRDADGAWLSRLGSAQRIYLNPPGLETVLQFDGRNSLSAAVQRLSARSEAPGAALARTVADFRQVLSAQHLLIAPGMLPC